MQDLCYHMWVKPPFSLARLHGRDPDLMPRLIPEASEIYSISKGECPKPRGTWPPWYDITIHAGGRSRLQAVISCRHAHTTVCTWVTSCHFHLLLFISFNDHFRYRAVCISYTHIYSPSDIVTKQFTAVCLSISLCFFFRAVKVITALITR